MEVDVHLSHAMVQETPVMTINQAKKYDGEIRRVHREIGPEVEKRLHEFRRIWDTADDPALFIELVFCILTPQSGARRCWQAVENLVRDGTLFSGGFDDICGELNIVRFKNNKTRYILEARERLCVPGVSLRGLLLESGTAGRQVNRVQRVNRKFLRACGTVPTMREWLFRNVKGLGYKEASHFLRNIGLGNGLAILDRHVLRSMHARGLINAVPNSIPPWLYCEMETVLADYARGIHVPLDHLDFVIWYQATGDIFK
ncbi:MAG: N-glycosylase/DNA lyase [Spirochaetes bacterium]|nr:N-glycosylase/DNA lyase [Spirochaetota bacterium]